MNQIENPIPQWLKNLQENSWQMELFISGGAIFSLFQLSDFVVDWTFTAVITYKLIFLGFIRLFSLICINLVVIGFLIHLLIRAFWIGVVCLNNVFPEGVNLKRLRFAYPFSIRKPTDVNLSSQIVKLDRYAGLVFFFSLVSSLILAGFVIFLFSISLPSLIPDEEKYNWLQLISIILIIPIPLYYLDFILYGLLRKIKWVSLILFPFFWLYDKVTLRFLYEKPLQVYSSNINRWKAAVIFLVAFSISLMISVGESGSYYGRNGWTLFASRIHLEKMGDSSLRVRQKHYMDELTLRGKKTRHPVIQSMIIKDRFLKIYVPYQTSYDEYFEENDSLKLTDFIRVVIDGDTIRNIQWHNYDPFDYDQRGLIGIHDIQGLSSGKHEITIFSKKDSIIDENKEHFEKLHTNINFWKE